MIRVLLLILAALPLLGQNAQVFNVHVSSLEERVAALEAKAQQCTLPPDGIAFWDPVERRVKILTLAEANALLVALANAINEASAQRAVQKKSK